MGERQSDDVDVVLLVGAQHPVVPTEPDVEQGHARLKIELAECEVDLGALRLIQRRGIVALE